MKICLNNTIQIVLKSKHDKEIGKIVKKAHLPAPSAPSKT